MEELAYNGYQWLYKSWAVAFDGSANRGAMAPIALLHVPTENDRQMQINVKSLLYTIVSARASARVVQEVDICVSLEPHGASTTKESPSASETDSGCNSYYSR